MLKCKKCGSNSFLVKEKNLWNGKLEEWGGSVIMTLSNQEPDGFDDPICEKCGKKLEDIDFEYDWQ